MYSLGIQIVLFTIFRLVEAENSLVTSETYATRDKEFMFTCNIGPTETAAVLTWNRNGVSVVHIQITDCLESDSGQGLYNFYKYNCTTSTRKYNLIIPTQRINNETNSQWKCGPSGGGDQSNTYTLQFYTPPTGDPVITGYNGTPRFLGNSVILTCTVSGGIPLATLTWTCKGISIQGTSLGISRHAVSIYTSYNGQRCTCTAAHPTWTVDKVVGSQVFVVHYPPKTNPVISGYDGSFRYKNDKITLTCRVSGGSPPATLSWTCNAQQQTSEKQSTSGATVTSNITVTMSKELNRKTCVCRGRHSDTRYTPNIESNQFIVYYPPSNPLIEVHPETPFPWIEGGNGKLQCSVNEGNPPVSYEWSTSDGLISGQNTNILSIPSLTKDYNGKGYKCKVSNAYTTDKNLNLVSQLKELDVEYNPVVDVGKTPAFVRETNRFERVCTADGNPTPTKIWTQDSIAFNGDTLTLVNIIRNQTGDYTCRARAQSKGAHETLTGQKVLNIIVQFPPMVQAVSEKTNVTEGQSVSMYCLARGVPDQYTYGGWVQIYINTVIRSGNDFLLSQNKRKLTLSRITYQDIGTYKCQAHNTITDKNGNLYQNGTTELNIKFAAIFDSSKKFHTELNKTADIKIPFFAIPVLQNIDNITLTKQNMNMKQRSDIQIQIKTTNLDIVFHGKTINVKGQEIIIRMFQFNSELQGNYTLGVKNYHEVSVSSFEFEVNPSGPPEHPKKFHIVKSTTNSVKLTWLAGNNGGHEQTFVISYQQTGKIDTLKTENITETDKKLNYTYAISNLIPDTEYSFWIYSYNVKGSTERNIGSMDPYVIKTLKSDNDTDGTVIGIVVALSVVLVVVGIIGFVLIKRRRRSSHRTRKKDGVLVNKHSKASINNDNEEREDELPINILYETTGSNYIKPRGVAYAEVNFNKENKSGLDNPVVLYSQEEKKKPSVDPSAIYADVNKSNRNQKDGRKPKKLFGKEKKDCKKETTPKVSNTNKEMGMVYENVENIKRDKSDNVKMYDSADEVHGPSTEDISPKMQSKPQKYEKKSKGDLNYADLELEVPAKNDKKKAVIHGIENRTDYAEVDFSRRAKPLEEEKIRMK